jgi:[glutamine synthetase] adenylyltransferase / [glutamine synthetase]-adenylyl-L-tyrosine phosphorylase
MTEQDLQGSAVLQALVAAALDRLEGHGAAATLSGAPPHLRDSLPTVLACSDFVARSLTTDPALLPDLIRGGDLIRSLAPQDFARRAPAAAPQDAAALPQEELARQMRHWRRREMVRIAWRDLARLASLEETLAELSAFAECALEVAAAHARQTLVARHGEPRSAAGEVQPLIMVAMGKLGGRELNFSSDVDLVLLFPEHGQTDGARCVSNEEFFMRLGQGLIRLLSAPSPEGIVLRIDLRLRPFGESGPLAASFAFLEDYLPRHGRDWERYAWVKARAISAPARYAQIEREAVHPFVYRRYLDYGMFASLREMKALIARQVARRDLVDDVKLGPGGIREVELIVQLFQLIRGGQDPRLVTPSLLSALHTLEAAQLMSSGVVGEIEAAYRHLRRLENRLQMLSDTQTHRLPADPAARERIALAMGQPDWPALLRLHGQHAARVMEHFGALLGSPPARPAATPAIDLAGLWEGEVSLADLAAALKPLGFPAEDAAEAAQLLCRLRSSVLLRRLESIGRARLQQLLPLLVQDLTALAAPSGEGAPAASALLPTLRRLLRILETIGQRSTYFALLVEAPLARRQLIDLAASGDFLTDQIAAHPLLLDELIGARAAELPGADSLRQELSLRMHMAQRSGAEAQIEALAQVQRAAVFRVAIADLAGRLPLMAVSDHLTGIAEQVVQAALDLAWQQISADLGEPMCDEEGGGERPARLCVVGYGKLGGREMGYASDLDLVLLHDSAGLRQLTRGPRPVDNGLFFVRLVQRLVHLLTVQTAAGRLYEVDMRLRPSGKGGLLVTGMHAFQQYQETQAWTWEHQALLHARAVAGAPGLCAEFERVRMSVLTQHVRRASLREDVRAMRERMRRERAKAGRGQLDLKQGPGGIADIEFLAQYWALLWAHDHPPLVLFSDTIRQLESVASADLVPQSTVDVLTEAYRAYRTRIHQRALAAAGPFVPADELAPERAAVTRIWRQTLDAP